MKRSSPSDILFIARALLIFSCFSVTEGLADLKGCYADGKDYCYGRIGTTGDWCWLTTDGTKFAKGSMYKNDKGCQSFDGYTAEKYCESKDGSPKIHDFSYHDKFEKCAGDSNDYCFCGIASWQKSNWCWVYSYGKFAKGSNYKKGCADFDGDPAGKFCQKIQYDAPSWQSSARAATGNSLGEYIAKWTKGQWGKRVTSDASGHRQTQCWDLGMAAIEAARKAGYNIPQSPGSGSSGYVWSNRALSAQEAQPGDIAQFVSWNQKGKKVTHGDGSWSTSGGAWTGVRHTAVVVGGYDGECFTTYDQNPSAVHKQKYCPSRRTGGSVIIYRLSASRLRLDSVDPSVADSTGFKPQSIPQALVWSSSVAAVTLFAMAGRSIWKRRQSSPDARLISVDATDDEDGSLE